jgi:type VI secretion system protein ImpA
MTSPSVFDFDALLAPIGDGEPTGPDLRRDFSTTNLYRRLKEARTAARRAETRAVWDDGGGGGDKPDWRQLFNDGQQLLANQSKDLEVAAWTVEAAVREHGFAGLRDGFRLCRELVERYWDNLHPNPDPDEPEDEDEGLIRVAAIAGLNGEESEGTLIAPILAVSIVETDEFGPLGVSAYEQAAVIERIEDPTERAKRIEHGAVSMDTFNKAIASSSPEFFARLHGDLEAAQEEYRLLNSALEERCGATLAPPTSQIRQALADCHRRITAIMPASAAEAPANDGSAGDGNKADAGHRPRVSGPVQTRDQAFDLIRQAAAYFREAEPHSVLSWQLDECVRWGQMPLPDLLKDLIGDESAREAFFRRVGIPRSSSEEV